SCTIANLAEGDQAVLKTGKSTKIRLTWETKQFSGDYEKYATILTSDPNVPEIKLAVKGVVEPALVLLPPEPAIDFSIVSNETAPNAFRYLAPPDRPELQIKEITTTNPKLVQVTATPISLEDREKMRLPYSGGYKLVIEIRPGTNLGLFKEDIRIVTD